VIFRFCCDDVGVSTRAARVVSTDAKEVARLRSEPGHSAVGDIANVQILKPGNKGAKRTARRDVQSVAGRTAYTAPVGSETARGDISCS